LNLILLIVSSAITGSPSWIFSLAISPYLRDLQYFMKESHAGCTDSTGKESGLKPAERIFLAMLLQK